MLDLVISIINTNNKNFLKGCLESIYKNTSGISYRICVIDNVSDDGSVQMVKESFPEVELIINNKKEGFPKNHNKVLKLTEAEFKLILNEDTLILDKAINKLVNFARKNKSIAAIGPRLLFKDGSFQPSAFYFPSIKSEIYKNISDRFFSKHKLGIIPQEECVKPRSVDWLNGSCILFRAQALSKIGYLDENFFIFFEDVDICKRLWENGWQIYYYPDAEIIHFYGGTRKTGIDSDMLRIFRESRNYYFLKHKGKLKSLFLNNALSLIDIIKRAPKKSKDIQSSQRSPT